MWVSVNDIIEVLDEVEALMETKFHGHPIANENFVQVAMRLVDTCIKSETDG